MKQWSPRWSKKFTNKGLTINPFYGIINTTNEREENKMNYNVDDFVAEAVLEYLMEQEKEA